jgi:predicted Rossmann fold nucleotide-binding protein DprA/Smf involved in DNA uptake
VLGLNIFPKVVRSKVVIESNGNGGALQQINLAVKQGRKVFVMEHLKTDKQATEGFKKFIKLGATPFDSPDVILEFLKNKKPEPRHVTLGDFLG